MSFSLVTPCLEASVALITPPWNLGCVLPEWLAAPQVVPGHHLPVEPVSVFLPGALLLSSPPPSFCLAGFPSSLSNH